MLKRKIGPCPDANRVIFASKGTSFIEIVAETMHEAAAVKPTNPTSAHVADLQRQRVLLAYNDGALLACAKERVEKAAALGAIHAKLFEMRIPNRHALGKVTAGPVEIGRDQTKNAASDAAVAHMAVWGIVSDSFMARVSFSALLAKALGPGCHVQFVPDERQPDLCVSIYLDWLQAVL